MPINSTNSVTMIKSFTHNCSHDQVCTSKPWKEEGTIKCKLWNGKRRSTNDWLHLQRYTHRRRLSGAAWARTPQ